MPRLSGLGAYRLLHSRITVLLGRIAHGMGHDPNTIYHIQGLLRKMLKTRVGKLCCTT